MTWLIVLAAVIIGLLLIGKIPIDFFACLEYHESKAETKMYLSIFGIKIRLGSEENYYENPDKEEKPEPEKKPKEPRITVRSLWDNRSKLIELWRYIKADIGKLLKYLLTKLITVKRLNIRAVLGLGKASDTALATGAANGVIYNVIALLYNNDMLDKFDVYIQPDFDNQRIDAELECTARIRVGHIMRVAGMAVKIFIKALVKYKRKS